MKSYLKMDIFLQKIKKCCSPSDDHYCHRLRTIYFQYTGTNNTFLVFFLFLLFFLPLASRHFFEIYMRSNKLLRIPTPYIDRILRTQ